MRTTPGRVRHSTWTRADRSEPRGPVTVPLRLAQHHPSSPGAHPLRPSPSDAASVPAFSVRLSVGAWPTAGDHLGRARDGADRARRRASADGPGGARPGRPLGAWPRRRRPGRAPNVDAVLLSHLHADHADLPSLRRVGRAPVVVPRGAGRWLGKRGGDVRELGVGESLRPGRAGGGHVRGARRTPLRSAARAPVGFVVRGPRSVYFAGDTDLFPAMADLAARSTSRCCRCPAGGRRSGPATSTPSGPRRRRPGSRRASRCRSTGARSPRRGRSAPTDPGPPREFAPRWPGTRPASRCACSSRATGRAAVKRPLPVLRVVWCWSPPR